MSLFRSQYFDEDGDLAHEFYEEHMIDDKPTMLRADQSSLKHQGRIKYRTPRLHYDFPSSPLVIDQPLYFRHDLTIPEPRLVGEKRFHRFAVIILHYRGWNF